MNRTSLTSMSRRVPRALGLSIVLGLAILCAGCGDDDDGGGPANPNLTGAEGVEASSGVAISTVRSLLSLATDLPIGSIGEGRRKTDIGAPIRLSREIVAARLGRAEGGDTALALLLECPGGGTADSACAVEGGVSTASLTFDRCRALVDGEDVTTDGVISIDVNSPSFCETGAVPVPGSIGITFMDFSLVSKTLQGVTLRELHADITMEFANEGPGCLFDVDNASIRMNGMMSMLEPGAGVDQTVITQNLLLSVTSEGSPCVLTILADGSLTSDDREGERKVATSFDDLTITATDLPNERFDFTIDGGMRADCLGGISFETLEPLTFVGAAECPVDGLVEVTLSDGSKGRIGFTTAGGITFDHDADGTIDATFESCHHDEIRDCAAASR